MGRATAHTCYLSLRRFHWATAHICPWGRFLALVRTTAPSLTHFRVSVSNMLYAFHFHVIHELEITYGIPRPNEPTPTWRGKKDAATRLTPSIPRVVL